MKDYINKITLFRKAGLAYTKAAECRKYLKDDIAAADLYIQAANCYKKAYEIESFILRKK